jgi:hypothetical protein
MWAGGPERPPKLESGNGVVGTGLEGCIMVQIWPRLPRDEKDEAMRETAELSYVYMTDGLLAWKTINLDP